MTETLHSIKNDPLVSVITPAYNVAHVVSETIHSVLKQTYSNWELIIVNDGSKDNTLEVIHTFKDDRIKLYSQENQGCSSARNAALQKAQGKYIAFLDADDLWEPNKLAVCISEMIEHRWDAVYTDFVMFKENVNLVYPGLQEDIFHRVEDQTTKMILLNFIGILTVVLDRKVIEDIGLFDVTLIGTEDWDFWIRTSMKYRFHYIHQQLSKYRISPSGLSKNFKRQIENEKKVVLKYNNIPQYSKAAKTTLWLINKKICEKKVRSGNVKEILTYGFVLLFTLPINRYFFNYLTFLQKRFYKKVVRKIQPVR